MVDDVVIVAVVTDVAVVVLTVVVVSDVAVTVTGWGHGRRFASAAPSRSFRSHADRHGFPPGSVQR